MRYGRVCSCASASTSATSVAATKRRTTSERIIAARGASVGGRGLPFGAVRGDGECDAAEEHERRKRDEGALVAPEDYQKAREQRPQRVAQALEQAVDAVDRVVAVDADLLLAMLGHERALRRDRQRLSQPQQEHDAEEHEEAVREQQQQA